MGLRVLPHNSGVGGNSFDLFEFYLFFLLAILYARAAEANSNVKLEGLLKAPAEHMQIYMSTASYIEN